VLALYSLIWVFFEKVLALWVWPQTINHEIPKTKTLSKTSIFPKLTNAMNEALPVKASTFSKNT
jgi:hypothetical protein